MSTQSIDKILIANRGEIACRVIRSARERGIRTVAVYSDADSHALHVKQADEAIHIGGSASTDSYLRIDRILEAVQQSGADAVHPGFGFLSENSKFAEALEAAGVIFIGPGTRAIETMGDKITSKKLAEQAGVNTVPGHPDAVPDADSAYRIAEHIGVPVMLKASAGGGGKGMRVAWTLDEVKEGFISAQNEARNAFGDDRVFVEKFIEQPRHIEIQIIADSHGNTLYLNERECSIQRRHQKVIEEAPSPFISEATRKAMGEQAVALSRAVDYRSAGTVEFIVDKHENFYFLEMNTRLQVEHPVTECITGLDLVGLMIDVAEGRELPLSQDQVRREGWAFEARVYAEDPDRGFLPSIGRITHYAPPHDLRGVRVDTGIEAGGEISMFYDPMIAKLITHAPTRDEAINRMQDALAHYRIEGVANNIPFLSALFDHSAVRAGDISTHFIDQHFPNGFNSREHADDVVELYPRIAAWLEQQCRERDYVNTGQPTGGVAPPDWRVFIDGDIEGVAVRSANLADVHANWQPGDWLFEGSVDGRRVSVRVRRQVPSQWELSANGAVRTLQVLDARTAELKALMPIRQARDTSKLLLSPMPGLLMKVMVNEGDAVKPGQELAVIEAMKMENTLRADIEGTVSKIVAAQGDSLAVDAVIMEFS